MKSATKFFSVMTLALAASAALTPAHAELKMYDEFPQQKVIDARSVVADQSLRGITYYSNLSLTVNFNTGSAALDAEAIHQVRAIAAKINNPAFRGSHILVAGYTDAAGKPAKNQALSYHRAVTVMHTLSSEYGVPASMMSAQGFGEADPVASNATKAGRAMNRRVVVTVQ